MCFPGHFVEFTKWLQRSPVLQRWTVLDILSLDTRNFLLKIQLGLTAFVAENG